MTGSTRHRDLAERPARGPSPAERSVLAQLEIRGALSARTGLALIRCPDYAAARADRRKAWLRGYLAVAVAGHALIVSLDPQNSADPVVFPVERPARDGCPWIALECEALDLVRGIRGATAAVIARILQRQPRAIIAKASALGLPLRNRRACKAAAA